MSLPDFDNIFVDGDLDWLSQFQNQQLQLARVPGDGNAASPPNSQPAKFSCPYRRRNPRVFNPRDFPTCAHGSFASITLVKRHVMSSHQARDCIFQCGMCSAWFRTQQALDNHSNSQICWSLPLPDVDQYDKGITEEMASKLRDRRGGIKVLKWEDLWYTIFPNSQGSAASNVLPIIEDYDAMGRY
ncbi:hypothetical protein ACHAPT_009533 [Fusarium lateritium]